MKILFADRHVNIIATQILCAMIFSYYFKIFTNPQATISSGIEYDI